MAQQENVSVVIAYRAESTYNTPAGTSAAQYIRRVSSSLTPNRDSFTSNEVRADQQVSDARLGTHRPGGTIEGELSNTSYDDWIEAVLRGTWAAGTTTVESASSTMTTVTGESTGSTFALGAGTWSSFGYKQGDIIRFTSLATTSNNAVNFRILSLSGATAVVYPPPTAMSADSAFSVSVQGYKLTNGTTKRSFTLEQVDADLDQSLRFDGARIMGMSINAQPNAMVTVTWDVMAKTANVLSGASSPYFVSPTAQQNTGIFSGVSGDLFIGTAAQAVITGLQFNLNLNPQAPGVAFNNYVPNVFYGKSVLTGSVSAMIEDTTLLNAFLDETETGIMAAFYAAGSAPLNFLSFVFNRIKFTSYTRTVGGDGPTIATLNFQALLQSGGATTNYDQSTMVVQRSV